MIWFSPYFFFFFQAEDGIRDLTVTGVQTCALPISRNFLRAFRIGSSSSTTRIWAGPVVSATQDSLVDALRRSRRRVGLDRPRRDAAAGLKTPPPRRLHRPFPGADPPRAPAPATRSPPRGRWGRTPPRRRSRPSP